MTVTTIIESACSPPDGATESLCLLPTQKSQAVTKSKGCICGFSLGTAGLRYCRVRSCVCHQQRGTGTRFQSKQTATAAHAEHMSAPFAAVIAVLVTASLGVHGYDVYEDGTIGQSLPGRREKVSVLRSLSDFTAYFFMTTPGPNQVVPLRDQSDRGGLRTSFLNKTNASRTNGLLTCMSTMNGSVKRHLWPTHWMPKFANME